MGSGWIPSLGWRCLGNKQSVSLQAIVLSKEAGRAWEENFAHEPIMGKSQMTVHKGNSFSRVRSKLEGHLCMTQTGVCRNQRSLLADGSSPGAQNLVLLGGSLHITHTTKMNY